MLLGQLGLPFVSCSLLGRIAMQHIRVNPWVTNEPMVPIRVIPRVGDDDHSWGITSRCATTAVVEAELNAIDDGLKSFSSMKAVLHTASTISKKRWPCFFEILTHIALHAHRLAVGIRALIDQSH